MNIIRVTGPQGSGKTSMVEAYVEKRCAQFDNYDDVLRIGAEYRGAMAGRNFHTIVCEDEPGPMLLERLHCRLPPGGVLIVVTNKEIT